MTSSAPRRTAEAYARNAVSTSPEPRARIERQRNRAPKSPYCQPAIGLSKTNRRSRASLWAAQVLVFVFIDIVDELARVFDDDFHEVIVGVIDAVDVVGVEEFFA